MRADDVLAVGKPVDMWSFGVILYILLGGYPPFYDKNPQRLFRKILRGQYEFHPAYWHEVSDEAKDLIRKLLQLDPKQRLTVAQVLAHPWFEANAAILSGRMLTMGLSEMRKFMAKRKLRAGIKAIMTVNRMKKWTPASHSLPSQTAVETVSRVKAHEDNDGSRI
jgi:serine/threonine protein kinase